MIDFTDYERKKKAYGGANGNKLSIDIDGVLYMLKLPNHAIKNQNLSYANSAVCEYLGCHIYRMLGIDTQDTILGTYNYHGKERIVVACKDFVGINNQLLDFASIKNQIIDSNSNGYGTELKDILETIEKQTVIDQKVLKDRFWLMFVVDALIGNWDRHNGNWGFLYNAIDDSIKLAPIYDCGSCLFPQIDEELISKVLSNKQEMNYRIFDVPTSAILIDGKRANYNKLLSSHEYSELDEAIKKVVSKINMSSIFDLIESVECISDNHKTFLKEIIDQRYSKLILANQKM